MESNMSANEMFFGNVIDQLANAALLDVSTLESIAADIDSKLESLQEKVVNAESGVNFVDPSVHQEGSGHSHCENDPLALNCFLTNVVQALERNQGLEDSILTEFLKFCSKNGFLLPPVTSEIEQDPQGSTASLNAVSDHEEDTRMELWCKVKSKIKAGFISKLRQSNLLHRLDFNQPGYQKEIIRRIQLIDLLMAVFPVADILDLYAKTREEQLSMFSAEAKKYSVSWADEEDISKVKELENLEGFVVTQLDMLNMDIPILWKINEFMPKFNIMNYIERVYLPPLLSAAKKVVKFYAEETSSSNFAAKLAIPDQSRTASSQPMTMDDVRFICKAFAIIWNWESEVTEIVGYFAVKPERRFSGEGLRSVLKGSPVVSPSTSKPGGLDSIIWDEDRDKSKTNDVMMKWPWRDQFKPVVPALEKCIRENLSNTASLVNIEEKNEPNKMIFVHDRLINANTSYPRMLPKKYGMMMSVFDEVITLASLGSGPIFEPIQAAFIEGVTTHFRECHADLTEVLESFPGNPVLEKLYDLICTVAFIAQHLRFYEDNMATNGKKPFRHICKMYDELLASAKSTVITYHVKILMTSILFDAQSNNWSDNKSFYEGERYSYCIQMWSYYIRCIHNDCWNKLPHSDAKEILFTVTNESLILLSGRYCKIRSSFARTKQYSVDVTAICDVCTWLIWRLANSSQEIMLPGSGESKISHWHSMCSNMLFNMILVSAPLKEVADFLTGSKSPSQTVAEELRPPNLLFLWSEPCLFPKPANSLCEMDGREAVFFVYKSIISQPYPKWSLILQSVLMRDALLPTAIASYSGDFKQITASPTVNGLEKSFLNENFIESREIETAFLDLETFVRHIYGLLFKASAKSDALAHFLMALANRENTWSLFDNHMIIKSRESCETPIWLQNIEKSLIPFLSRAFLPSLEMICEPDRKRCQPSFAFTNIGALPCGCTAVEDDTSSNEISEGELLYQCLVSTLNVLTENLNTIPKIIAVFFNRLNDYLYQRHFSAATKSPGLKVLAFVSYKWLTVQENIYLLFDFAISDATMGRIKCFAELVWHLLFNLTTDVSQNRSIPTDILSYIKANKVWLQEKLKVLTNYFKGSVVTPCNNNFDQMPNDLAESQYTALTSNLMSAPEGRESLQFVYDVLKNNQRIIEKKLLSQRHTSCTGKICKQVAVQGKKNSFSPLVEYQMFGDYMHNQEDTIEMQRDWLPWLHITEKFPVPVIKRIILGRQEFIPDSYSYLTDEEKIAHEKLLRYFEEYSSTVNERPLSSSSSSTRSSSDLT